MANRDSNNLLERYLSDDLEVAHNPRHDPRESPPELIPGQAPERIYESLECPVTDFPEIIRSSNDKKRTYIDKRGCWWGSSGVVMFFVAVAAGVGGGVGGRRKHISSTTPLTPTSSPSSQPTPLASPTPPGLVSNSSASLLRNTSIAPATCANGNRWLFSQHMTGSIHGSQYLLSNSEWTTTSTEMNFTVPKMGTGLTASCVYIDSFYYQYSPLEIGDYISLVYLDNSNQIQQTVMENGTWRNSPIAPPILPPANDTKLSISTVLVPISPTVNGGFSLPLVSSVLTYVSTNISKTATTLVSVEPDYSPVNSSSAGIASLVKTFISNVSNSDYFSVNLYSRFSIGANYQLHSWSIDDFNYYYNLSMLRNPMAAEVSASDLTDPSSFATDISLLQFPNNATAQVYAQPNNSLAVTLYTFSANQTGAIAGVQGWNSPVILPFGHFSATSLPANSTTLYCYYQVNETTVAEISLNTTAGLWSELAYVTVV